MIIKYSAQNFTARKVCDLQPGDMILETEKKKKLRVIEFVTEFTISDNVPESDVGKCLICFSDCSQLVKSPQDIVFVFNEANEFEKPVMKALEMPDDAPGYSYPIAFAILFFPVVLIYFLLTEKKSTKN